MGAFLDSSKNIRQDKKNPPGQAYKIKKTLEKKKEQGVKMAKKEEASKIILERTYVVPLRMQTLKSPKYKKAKKAISTIKIFISKHMKSNDIKIGRYLNLKIWKHGIKNPPHKVKVTAAKDDKGMVFVELADAPKPKVEESKKPAKKEDKVVKEAEFKEIKEEKAEEAKKIEKEEIKELMKEQKEHIPMHHAPKIPPKQKFQQQRPTAPKSI